MSIRKDIIKHHMIQSIRDTEWDNVSISRDHGVRTDIGMVPILLYTPHMKDAAATHYHIEFTREEAEALRDWLNRYLSMIS